MPATILCALLALAEQGAPVRLMPPAPPQDLGALLAADPAKDAAAARRQLSENGVPAAVRTKAAETIASATRISVVIAVLDAIYECKREMVVENEVKPFPVVNMSFSVR